MNEVANRPTADGSLSRLIDPLAPLRGLGLDDSVLRPVSRLLFAERLISDQVASMIDTFVLGPSERATAACAPHHRSIRANRT